MERMDEYGLARRMLMVEVSGGRIRGRPRFGWTDGVLVELCCRLMMAEGNNSRKIARNGEPCCIYI